MPSLIATLKHLLTVPVHAIRACFAEWAVLMPAKSREDEEYEFPQGRWAGQGSTYR